MCSVWAALDSNLQPRPHGVMESKSHLDQEHGLLVSALPLPRFVTLGKLASVGLSSLTCRMGIVRILPL